MARLFSSNCILPTLSHPCALDSGIPCRNDEASLNLTNLPKDDGVIKVYPVSLRALTAAALILPGLFQPTAKAAEEDSFDFQYSHYQEGRRDGINALVIAPDAGSFAILPASNNRNPIEVDSLHGSGRFSLTDRVKFAFNYIQDTWSSATPFGSAPEFSGANRTRVKGINDDGTPVYTGASPIVGAQGYFDNKGNFFTKFFNSSTLQDTFIKNRTVHVMGYASPETRKHGNKVILS